MCFADQNQICNHPGNCSPNANCRADGGSHWDPQLEITKRTDCEDIKYDAQWVAFRDSNPIKSTASLPQVSDVAGWWSVHSNYSTRWVKQSRTPAFTDPYVPTGPTNTSVPTTGASISKQTLPTSSDTTPAGIHKESSPKGHKLGLAVGLGAGIPLLLAGVGFLIFYLRQHRRQAGTSIEPDTWLGMGQGDESNDNDKKQLPAGEDRCYFTKVELPAEELPRPVPEIEGSNVGDSTSENSDKPSMLDPLSSRQSGRNITKPAVNNSPVFELPG